MSDNALDRLKKCSPNFRDGHDAVAFAIHTIILDCGCQLVGLSENDESKKLSDCPDGWNASADTYCFLYEDSSKNIILLKLLRMDRSLLVHAASKSKPDKVNSLDLSVSDYINSDAAADQYDKLYKDFEKLAALIQSSIAESLVAKKAQVGSDDAKESIISSGVERPRIHDPSRPDPLIDHRDPLRVYPPRGRGPRFPGGDFGGDLDPFGGGGGSLLGPRHPGFGSGVGGPGGIGPGGIGPGGTGIPPGARFDPFGPGVPFPPPGGGRGRGGMGRRGADPDRDGDHLRRPPNNNSHFDDMFM